MDAPTLTVKEHLQYLAPPYSNSLTNLPISGLLLQQTHYIQEHHLMMYQVLLNQHLYLWSVLQSFVSFFFELPVRQNEVKGDCFFFLRYTCLFCTSCDGLLRNLGFKNSVDTAMDLYKDVRFLMCFQRFLVYRGFGWGGERGFIQGTYMFSRRVIVLSLLEKTQR